MFRFALLHTYRKCANTVIDGLSPLRLRKIVYWCVGQVIEIAAFGLEETQEVIGRMKFFTTDLFKYLGHVFGHGAARVEKSSVGWW